MFQWKAYTQSLIYARQKRKKKLSKQKVDNFFNVAYLTGIPTLHKNKQILNRIGICLCLADVFLLF